MNYLRKLGNNLWQPFEEIGFFNILSLEECVHILKSDAAHILKERHLTQEHNLRHPKIKQAPEFTKNVNSTVNNTTSESKSKETCVDWQRNV